MSDLSESNHMSDHGNTNKKVKSELYHIWKKARVMYDMVKDESNLEGWVKNNIAQAYDLIDQAMRYSEYEQMFPEKQPETPEEEKNNFLTNEDKRYPTPTAQESGDQFMTRCILDANMKKRYPVQGDRFAACMSIYNENKDTPSENPGEKFQDPMQVKEDPMNDPIKPLLP